MKFEFVQDTDLILGSTMYYTKQEGIIISGSFNKDKDEAVVLLEQERRDLEDKLKSIESDIDIEVGKGNDRPSSNILKDTFRKLGVMK